MEDYKSPDLRIIDAMIKTSLLVSSGIEKYEKDEPYDWTL